MSLIERHNGTRRVKQSVGARAKIMEYANAAYFLAPQAGVALEALKAKMAERKLAKPERRAAHGLLLATCEGAFVQNPDAEVLPIANGYIRKYKDGFTVMQFDDEKTGADRRGINVQVREDEGTLGVHESHVTRVAETADYKAGGMHLDGAGFRTESIAPVPQEMAVTSRLIADIAAVYQS